MNSRLKLLLSLTAALCAAPFAAAQVTLNDFSSFAGPNTLFFADWELTGDSNGSNAARGTFSQDLGGFYNFTGGSNDETALALHFFDAPLDITGLSLLEISAQILAGNTAPGFTISLFDSLGESAFAAFSTADFTGPGFGTLYADLIVSGSFNYADVSWFTLSGNAAGGTETLNLAVNHLAVVAAVPEPATYGAFAALALVGLVACKRFRRSAV